MIEQLRLGTSGLHVSRIALGMMSFGDKSRREWALDEHEAEPIVLAAIEQGITFFDTADMYAAGASEVVTGRVLKKLISRAGGGRDEALLPDDGGPKRARPLAETRHGSNRRLARAARNGLRRSHPGSSLRHADAGRGNHGGARRRREVRKGPAPIVGATRLAHVEDAVAATQLELSPEERDRLIEAYRPYPVERSAG
jgi:aryl-alcohol dehydrogenase-like predicted oxidoreductase